MLKKSPPAMDRRAFQNMFLKEKFAVKHISNQHIIPAASGNRGQQQQHMTI
jgi:hypothetical protein